MFGGSTNPVGNGSKSNKRYMVFAAGTPVDNFQPTDDRSLRAASLARSDPRHLQTELAAWVWLISSPSAVPKRPSSMVL